jgi:hypothetical protein
VIRFDCEELLFTDSPASHTADTHTQASYTADTHSLSLSLLLMQPAHKFLSGALAKLHLLQFRHNKEVVRYTGKYTYKLMIGELWWKDIIKLTILIFL